MFAEDFGFFDVEKLSTNNIPIQFESLIASSLFVGLYRSDTIGAADTTGEAAISSGCKMDKILQISTF